MKKTTRTRYANRFCMDCGKRKLTYYPNLSNPKAPNDHRVLVYACTNCTADFEKPKFIAVQRNATDDPYETVRVKIVQPARAATDVNNVNGEEV